MPITVVKTKSGMLAYRTRYIDKHLILDLYITDENLTTSQYQKHYVLDMTEEEFHRDLREKEDFIRSLCSNPEWNP